MGERHQTTGRQQLVAANLKTFRPPEKQSQKFSWPWSYRILLDKETAHQQPRIILCEQGELG